MLPYLKKLMEAVSKGGGAYAARAVSFDGTDWLRNTNDFIDNAEGKTGILSFWLKLTGNDSGEHTIYRATGDGFTVLRDAAGTIYIYGFNSGGTIKLGLPSASQYSTSDGWFHVLASWDLATGTTHLYINGVNDKGSSTAVNENIDYTKGTHWMGTVDNGGDTKMLYGDLCDFYFNNEEYIDLSVEANRRLFIDAAGKPVDLGVDGSTPTGSIPILFLSLADGDAVATFATNKGDGGGMTSMATLTEASTSPSD